METQCGQSVQLSVTLSRSDAAVQWLKNEQPIDDARITTSADGCNRTLHISKVRYPGDSGTYRCQVADQEKEELKISSFDQNFDL